MTRQKHTNKTRLKQVLVGLLACLLAGLQSCYQDNFLDGMTGADDMEKANARLSAFESVVQSDELWEFKAAALALSDKCEPLYQELTDEEWEELEKHKDDTAYLEQFLSRIDVSAEVKRIEEARKQLHENTAFLQLSEEEQNELYDLLAETDCLEPVTRTKTRSEGDKKEECEKARREAYEMAESAYHNALNKDENTAFALTIRQLTKKKADQEYEDCINNR